jgi:hypothetical protein
MRRILNPQFSLLLIFLGIVVSVPVIQVAVELCRGELPHALQIFKRKPTARNLRTYERGLEDASWVAGKLRPWAQYVQFSWLKDGGEKSVIGRDNWLFYKPGVEYVTQRPGVHAGTTTTSDVVAAIIDLRNQLAARGIPLLVMPTPDKEGIYPEKLTWRAASLRTVMGSETREVMNRLQLEHIEVVDLFELFTKAKMASPSPLYLAQDSHWSPVGVELAARAVAQRIRQRGWVQLGSVGYEIKSAQVERVGDILRMLQVPQLESEATTQSVVCHQVLRQCSAEPYRDEVDSEILVLGDSFLRIYQTDEPGASGFIAHLARELRQPVTSIVNDGGASTLVRQELNRRPGWLAHKKVVIWEFVERDIRFGAEGWQHVPLPEEKRTL